MALFPDVSCLAQLTPQWEIRRRQPGQSRTADCWSQWPSKTTAGRIRALPEGGCSDVDTVSKRSYRQFSSDAVCSERGAEAQARSDDDTASASRVRCVLLLRDELTVRISEAPRRVCVEICNQRAI
ncbi:hypothetical protein EYF80_009764 [Liparis tanakae]|uniref:Uncharacterized protein n=1 Tax=Liparis tanakae TaxID=230148 RepID=A0A4Z2IQ81_9TELE|nr:hypothetical protein EYF80_009764 [Liparis tanakae]